MHYDAKLFTYVALCVTAFPADLLASLWLMGILNVPKQHLLSHLPAILSESVVSFSGGTLSTLISSQVLSPKPRGQLLPTLGAVIYRAPLYCLWLPSGRLSGLWFSQTAASSQIIIRLRPAVWQASIGLLLLIELDPMLEVTEKWTVSPSEPCD